MSKIPSATSRYLGVMRGAHQVTEALGVPLIDTDVAPDHDTYGPEGGSIYSFSKQIDELVADMPADEPLSHFMKKNLLAAQLAFPVITGRLKIGKDIDHPDFVRHTMGIRPEQVPETTDTPEVQSLATQREAIETVVEQLGFHFHPDDREAFFAEYAVPDEKKEQAIESLLVFSKEFVARAVGSKLLRHAEDPIVIVQEFEGTWQAHAGADENKNLLLEINTNPLVQMSAAEQEFLIGHELTHLGAYAVRKLANRQGIMAAPMSMVPVFSRLVTQDEIAARAIEAEIAAAHQDEPEYQFVALHSQYACDVALNMILRANAGYSQEEVADYGKNQLRFSKPEKVERMAEKYATDLLYKTLFAVDSAASRIGKRIAALPAQEKRKVMQRLFMEPVSGTELTSLGRQPVASAV